MLTPCVGQCSIALSLARLVGGDGAPRSEKGMSAGDVLLPKSAQGESASRRTSFAVLQRLERGTTVCQQRHDLAVDHHAIHPLLAASSRAEPPWEA